MIKKTRVEKFYELSKHPWYKKIWSKLSQNDEKFIALWLKNHEHLGLENFEIQASRLFIDQAEKPKNHMVIVELITATNIKENLNGA